MPVVGRSLLLPPNSRIPARSCHTWIGLKFGSLPNGYYIDITYIAILIAKKGHVLAGCKYFLPASTFSEALSILHEFQHDHLKAGTDFCQVIFNNGFYRCIYLHIIMSSDFTELFTHTCHSLCSNSFTAMSRTNWRVRSTSTGRSMCRSSTRLSSTPTRHERRGWRGVSSSNLSRCSCVGAGTRSSCSNSWRTSTVRHSCAAKCSRMESRRTPAGRWSRSKCECILFFLVPLLCVVEVRRCLHVARSYTSSLDSLFSLLLSYIIILLTQCVQLCCSQ